MLLFRTLQYPFSLATKNHLINTAFQIIGICVPIHFMMPSALLIKYGNTTIRAIFHTYFKTLTPYNLSSFSTLSKALSSFCKSNFSLSTFFQKFKS